MEKSKLSSLMKRTITALVLLPLTIAALYYGYPYVNVMALVFGGMLAWEWPSMVPNSKPAFYTNVYALTTAAAIFIYPGWVLLAVFIAALLLTAYKSREEAHSRMLIWGVVYIALGIGALVWTYYTVGYFGTLWFLLMVWSVDVGGYLVGSTLRGPKLAPKISPNKTWSGLIGGVLLAMVVSFVFVFFIEAYDSIVFYEYMAAIIAVIAQIGDLFESYFKRLLGVKDSSNLIPGHGGAFDRLDGVIFAAPFMFLICYFGLFFY